MQTATAQVSNLEKNCNYRCTSHFPQQISEDLPE